MSKIYNEYSNKIDKTWYDSSNIIYSECDDIDDSLKRVRITFKDGRTYQYNDVDVNEYLLFREASSQGIYLNKKLKKYPNEFIGQLNAEEIWKDLEEKRSNKEQPQEVELVENSVSSSTEDIVKLFPGYIKVTHNGITCSIEYNYNISINSLIASILGALEINHKIVF